MRTSRVRGRTITRTTSAATPIFFFIVTMLHIIQLKIIQVIDVNASSLSPSYIHHHDSHHHRRHEINKIKQTQLKPIPKPKPKPAPITTSPLPLSNHRILILPGFFHTQKQYKANHDHYRDHDSNTYNPKKSSSLEQSLIKEHGWKQNQIKVLPIKFLDWIQVFTKGLIDYKFWIGTTTPTSPAFKWYLDYIKVEIEKFYIDFENEKKEKRMMICDNGDGNGNGNGNGNDDNHEKKMEEELVLINKEQKYCSENSNDNGNDKTMYDDNDDGNNDHGHHDVDNDNNDDEKLKIILIGHSAGGWLARAALGFMLDQEQEGAAGIGTVSTNNDHDHDYDHNGRQIEKETKKGKNIDLLSCVCGVVTLGSPHTSPKHDCMDITRGALRKTNERFPGAYYAPKIFYISVIGDAIKGKKQQSTTKKQFPASLFDLDLYNLNLNLNHVISLEGFAYESYSKVCGNGDEVGDGVVPCCAGHIDGGTHITLDGVQHSHTFPGDWYGSPNVIDSWHDVMLNQIMSSNAKDAHEKE